MSTDHRRCPWNEKSVNETKHPVYICSDDKAFVSQTMTLGFFRSILQSSALGKPDKLLQHYHDVIEGPQINRASHVLLKYKRIGCNRNGKE